MTTANPNPNTKLANSVSPLDRQQLAAKPSETTWHSLPCHFHSPSSHNFSPVFNSTSFSHTALFARHGKGTMAPHACFTKQKQSTPMLSSRRPPHPGPQPFADFLFSFKGLVGLEVSEQHLLQLRRRTEQMLLAAAMASCIPSLIRNSRAVSTDSRIRFSQDDTFRTDSFGVKWSRL